MIFNRATRAKLIATVTTDFDPATATLEVDVGGTWYPATWTTAATSGRGTWTRTGTTDSFFLGPDATGGGVTLPAGRTSTRTRVTSGGEVIVAYSSPIDVR